MDYTITETVRTVRITLNGAPKMLVPTYSRRPNLFQPDVMVVKVHGPNVRVTVDISGPFILKSGRLSKINRENELFIKGSGKYQNAPEWLRSLVDEITGKDPVSDKTRTELESQIYAEEYGHPYTEQGRQALRRKLRGI